MASYVEHSCQFELDARRGRLAQKAPEISDRDIVPPRPLRLEAGLEQGIQPPGILSGVGRNAGQANDERRDCNFHCLTAPNPPLRYSSAPSRLKLPPTSSAPGP